MEKLEFNFSLGLLNPGRSKEITLGVIVIKVSAFSPYNNAVGYCVYSSGYLVIGHQ